MRFGGQLDSKVLSHQALYIITFKKMLELAITGWTDKPTMADEGRDQIVDHSIFGKLEA